MIKYDSSQPEKGRQLRKVASYNPLVTINKRLLNKSQSITIYVIFQYDRLKIVYSMDNAVYKAILQNFIDIYTTNSSLLVTPTIKYLFGRKCGYFCSKDQFVLSRSKY